MGDARDKKDPDKSLPFKLHYFPQILMDGGDTVSDAEESKGDFKQKSACQQKEAEVKAPSKEELEAKAQEKKLKEMIERSYQEGYEKGLQEGIQREKERLSSSVKVMEASVKDFKIVKEKVLIEGEAAILSLSFQMAKKILQREIKTSPDLITGVIQSALKGALDHQNVTIRLHPLDHEMLTSESHQYKEILKDYKDIEFIPDESITMGGCFIESDFGIIDARIESQLNILENEINATLFENRSELKDRE